MLPLLDVFLINCIGLIRLYEWVWVLTLFVVHSTGVCMMSYSKETYTYTAHTISLVEFITDPSALSSSCYRMIEKLLTLNHCKHDSCTA